MAQYQSVVEYDEMWRSVPGYEGLYEVSSFGRVRSHHDPRGPRLLKPSPSNGYPTVGLVRKGGSKRNFKVHRLVLAAFIGEQPDGWVTRHYDGNPENNYLHNLVYGTPQQNSDDTRRHGSPVGRPRQSHCKRGHPLSGDNVRHDIRGHAVCVTCDRARSRKYYRQRVTA